MYTLEIKNESIVEIFNIIINSIEIFLLLLQLLSY